MPFVCLRSPLPITVEVEKLAPSLAGLVSLTVDGLEVAVPAASIIAVVPGKPAEGSRGAQLLKVLGVSFSPLGLDDFEETPEPRRRAPRLPKEPAAPKETAPAKGPTLKASPAAGADAPPPPPAASSSSEKATS